MRHLSGYNKLGRNLSRVLTRPDILLSEQKRERFYLLDSEGYRLKDSDGNYLMVNG